MGQIIYYMPGIITTSKEKVQEAGLGYALGREGPSYSTMAPGPDGGRGVVFVLKGSLHVPEDTKWEKYPGREDLWMGYDPANRPGPEDLAREKQFAGHLVELSDGKSYLVPVARAVDGSTPLPRKLTREGKNWIVGDVEEIYREYFAQACRVWDQVYAVADKDDKQGEETAITIEDGSDVAAMALGLNYRLGPEEMSLLGLFNTENMANVLKAVVDWPGFEEMIKKKITAGKQSSEPGSGA